MSYFRYMILLLLVWALIFRVLTNNKKWFCIFSGVTLALFQGFRDYSVGGVDLIRYYRTYNTLAQYNWFEVKQFDDGENVLYYLINSIFAKSHVPYQTFLLVISIFCVIVTVWFIYKHSEYPFLSIAIILGLQLYTFQFSGLKQSLSMACALIAFDANMERKNAKTIIWTLASILFHFAGMVIVPYLFLMRLKITKNKLVVYFFSLIVIIMFRVQIGRFLVVLFRETYIGRYTSAGAIGGTALFLLIVALLYLYCFYEPISKGLFNNNDARKPKRRGISFILQKKQRITGEQEEIINEEMNASFYGLFILVTIQLCASFSYTFTRVNMYFIPMLTLAFSSILNSQKIQKRFKPYKIVKYSIIGIVSFYMFYQFLRTISGQSLDHYRFFWEML